MDRIEFIEFDTDEQDCILRIEGDFEESFKAYLENDTIPGIYLNLSYLDADRLYRQMKERLAY
jgi:hypothetical protein